MCDDLINDEKVVNCLLVLMWWDEVLLCVVSSSGSLVVGILLRGMSLK